MENLDHFIDQLMTKDSSVVTILPVEKLHPFPEHPFKVRNNEEMAELKASDMKGLILDLRSNPGGDLTAVTEVARRILPAGAAAASS